MKTLMKTVLNKKKLEKQIQDVTDIHAKDKHELKRK